MNPASQPAPAPQKSRATFWATILASKFLLVSIAVHLLFGAGAAVYVIQRYQAGRKLSFQGGPPVVNASSRALEHKVSMAKKKNTMSAPAQAKRITTSGLSKIALPEIVTMPNATTVVPNRMGGIGGTGTGLGAGGMGGSGTGGGGGFSLPNVMNDRCSAASRAAAMKASGGDPKSEEAILKGLRWLKAHQNGDGSFGQQFQASMTGLALLSLMGHCEKPVSIEFGATVRKAIDFLTGLGAAQGGKMSRLNGQPWCYEHGIATYALGEAYILTKEPKIAEVFTKAINIIVQGQGADGGWMYELNKAVPSDTSVTGWQIQALKTAHLSGLNLPGVEQAMNKAVDNTMRCRGPKGGFGYRGPEDRPSLTPVGIVILQIVKHERGTVVRQAIDFFFDGKDAPKFNYDAADAHLYSWYYGAQACFQQSGSGWHKWNREVMPQLLAKQAEDGSWPEPRGGKGGGLHESGTGTDPDAQVYRNSLCILMLEVYYRYLASSRG